MCESLKVISLTDELAQQRTDSVSKSSWKKKKKKEEEGVGEIERANLLLIVIWCLLERIGNRTAPSCGSCPNRTDKRVVELN